jgi:hypothetical protein
MDAASVAIVVAFAAGWLMRRWRGSENTLRVARGRRVEQPGSGGSAGAGLVHKLAIYQSGRPDLNPATP